MCAETSSDSGVAIDLVVEETRWLELLPDAEALARRAAAAGLVQADFDAPAEICVLLGDDVRIGQLNSEFRNRQAPTNVLSFPAADTPRLPGRMRSLGDIALSLDTLEREAREAGIPLADHFAHLIVHASLHLIGYDHQDDEEADRMEALEVAALAGLGIADPYGQATPEQAAHGTRES